MMKGKQVSSDHLLHQEVAQLLSAYLDGQVDDQERHQIEQHLSTCPVCRANLESLRRVVRLLNRLPAVTPPRPFTLRPEWVAPTRPPVWRWLFGIPGLTTGLAALMCVVVLAGALLYRLGLYRSAMPLARMPMTYSIPTPSTVESSSGVISTVTLTVPSSAAAHDEIDVLVATPLPVPTLASPVPSQPVAPLVASPVPSPEDSGKWHGVPSPTPLVTQPEPESESAAKMQPAPQRTEVSDEVTVEEETQAQRYEVATSPEPSFTAPPAVGMMAVSGTPETSATRSPSEEAGMTSEPPPAVVAAAPPATEIPGASMPSVAEAALSPEPSPAAETPVMSSAVPTEAPTMPSPTQVPALPAELSPTAEATATPSAEAPVISTAPSRPVEMETVPLETVVPPAPTETPTTSPTEEALPSTAEEGVPVTLTMVEPETTEAPDAGPTEAVPTPTRVLIPVRDLRLTIKPGLIRVEGALPLPPGQSIQADLWREGALMKWAIPETQRGKVQEEGRFELELKAPPDHPDFDLFRLPPARYEVRIVPLDFEAAVEARIPFDTFPPATKQP